MSAEEKSAMARRFVKEHNQSGYLSTFEEMLAPDCIVHEYLPGVPESMDRTAFGHFIAMFRSAMPDIQNSVEDVVAGPDKAAVRWNGRGTHTGAPLMGIPASNSHVTAHGIYILSFARGKIVEIWNNWDNLNVMQQLGPPAGQPKQQ